ncbi:MAG: hypothetical protein ACQEVA_20110, partial [Myxococcota bacterium]
MHHSIAIHGRRRLKTWLAACGLMAFALGAAPGCSGDDGGGAGDSCEVDADCKEGLRCRDDGDGKVCVEAAGNNGGADAGDTTNQDGESDGETMVMEEDYFISYVLADSVDGDNREIRVWSTADETETSIDLGGVDCSSGCWINRDASHVIYQKPTVSGPAGSGDIFKIPLNASFEPQGDDSSATEVARGVTSVKVIGNTITYKRGDSAYYQPADGSDETELGVIEDGGWHVDTDANVSLIYDPVPATAQNLDIYMGDASGASQKVFQINSENYQEIGGSYYGQNVPTAVSPDGSIAALVTSGPNNYQTCDDASECSGPEQKCGFQGF